MDIRGIVVLAVAGLAVACSGSDTSDKGSSSGGSSSGGSSSGGSSSGSSGKTGSPSSSSGNVGESKDPTEPTKKAYGSQCAQSSDCQSDFCVFLRGGGSLGMCTQTCEGDIDCPGLGSKCVALSDAPQKVCVPE